jgi:predicted RNA-binding protein with TRAM domain
MQASKINLDNEYAANWKGREVAIRVTELRTTRNRTGVTNHVIGYLADADGALKGEKVAIEVKDVIDDLAKHTALNAEKKRRADEYQARQDARAAKQIKAVTLLAEAIGAQAVIGNRYSRDVTWDSNAPAVLVDSHGIELNEEAIPGLLAFLESLDRKGATAEHVPEAVV